MTNHFHSEYDMSYTCQHQNEASAQLFCQLGWGGPCVCAFGAKLSFGPVR